MQELHAEDAHMAVLNTWQLASCSAQSPVHCALSVWNTVCVVPENHAYASLSTNCCCASLAKTVSARSVQVAKSC